MDNSKDKNSFVTYIKLNERQENRLKEFNSQFKNKHGEAVSEPAQAERKSKKKIVDVPLTAADILPKLK